MSVLKLQLAGSFFRMASTKGLIIQKIFHNIKKSFYLEIKKKLKKNKQFSTSKKKNIKNQPLTNF